MSNPYEFHPACLALPKMADDEYLALRDSIRAGYDANKPIELFEGQILDGRHRYQACQDEGIAPTFSTLTGVNPYEYVRKVHEGRRSWLNGVQKALVIGGLLEKAGEFDAAQQRIREEANRKRAEAANARRDESGKLTSKPVEPQSEARQDEPATLPTVALIPTPISAPIPPAPKPPAPSNPANKTAAAKAQTIGVSRANVERAEAIKRASPEIARKVETGEITPTEAQRQIKKAQVADKVAALPAGKYRVIYADPPWKYNDTQGGSISDSYGAAEKHYPSMSLSELSALPIPDLSQDHAVLFLWATSPLLPDALKLGDAWGFKYKAAFIWDKVKHNMGHYNSVRHELLLICTKGSCTPDVAQLFDSVQSIERTHKHSEKPEEFRAIIDTLYPHGPRIELFRRGVAPNGWTVWGNEAEQAE